MAYCKSVRGDKKKGDISDQQKTNGSDNKIDDLSYYTAPIFPPRIKKNNEYDYVYGNGQKN